jgi:hypothetical protein
LRRRCLAGERLAWTVIKLTTCEKSPGQLYYFRFHAQTRKGPVDFSQVVSLMIH